MLEEVCRRIPEGRTGWGKPGGPVLRDVRTTGGRRRVRTSPGFASPSITVRSGFGLNGGTAKSLITSSVHPGGSFGATLACASALFHGKLYASALIGCGSEWLCWSSKCRMCATSACERPLFVHQIDRLRKIVRDERLEFALFDSASATPVQARPKPPNRRWAYFRVCAANSASGRLHIAHVRQGDNNDQRPFGLCFLAQRGADDLVCLNSAAISPDRANTSPLAFLNWKAELECLAARGRVQISVRVGPEPRSGSSTWATCMNSPMLSPCGNG